MVNDTAPFAAFSAILPCLLFVKLTFAVSSIRFRGCTNSNIYYSICCLPFFGCDYAVLVILFYVAQNTSSKHIFINSFGNSCLPTVY